MFNCQVVRATPFANYPYRFTRVHTHTHGKQLINKSLSCITQCVLVVIAMTFKNANLIRLGFR